MGLFSRFFIGADHKGGVMPGLVPGIHVLGAEWSGVDGRDKPGHDGVERVPLPPHPLDHLLDMGDRRLRLDAVAEIEDQPPLRKVRQHVVDGTIERGAT
ncbi:hypothetical protein SAMN05192541_12799 [Bradyrhizobium arachidis]|nr:hypothetical protein SAMN05192541_12799 [Bradyrhizobium arachidis]